MKPVPARRTIGPMLAILRFEPIIVYITLGVCAVVAVGRLMLAWALRD
jgi:hypothetical protein